MLELLLSALLSFGPMPPMMAAQRARGCPSGQICSPIAVPPFVTKPATVSGSNWCVGMDIQPPASWAAADRYPMSNGNYAPVTANTVGVELYTDGKVYITDVDSASRYRQGNASHGFSSGTKHKLSACFLTTGQKLYLDGVDTALSSSGTGNGIRTAIFSFNIGAKNSSAGNPFLGTIYSFCQAPTYDTLPCGK